VDDLPTFDEAAGLPNRNLLYNGAMQVHQRGTSAAGITSSGHYTADRWRTAIGSAGTYTQSIENDAPTGSGFRKSLKILCTTAETSLGSTDLAILLQKLEGQDLQRLAKGTPSAVSVTVSFWVKSNVTGTYIIDLFDSTNARGVSASYSISASATWEKKTLTFAGDTSGVLANDNAESLNVRWWLAAGSAYQSGSLQEEWAASSSSVAVGQTNVAAATNNYWQVTGMQLEVGTAATPFEFKPFGQELAECQRYYWKPSTFSGEWKVPAWNWVSNQQNAVIVFPTTMRTGPSILASSGTNHHTFYIAGGVSYYTTVTANNSTADCCDIYVSTSGKTAGQSGWYSPSGNGSIEFNAEL
jgi:hypothetical protein